MDLERQRKFENLWATVESQLGGYFYRQGCPSEDARDLIQETAIRAWRNYDTLKGEFRAWVFGIARFVFIDYLRKGRFEADLPEDLVIPDDRIDIAQDEMNKTLVRQCLESLEEIDRQCLILHDMEGYNFRKIGEILGISLSNAHYHVDRARKILRERFPDLSKTRMD